MEIERDGERGEREKDDERDRGRERWGGERGR